MAFDSSGFVTTTLSYCFTPPTVVEVRYESTPGRAPVRASRSNVGRAPIDGSADPGSASLAGASDATADGASTLGATDASELAAGDDEPLLLQAAAISPVATARAVRRVRCRRSSMTRCPQGGPVGRRRDAMMERSAPQCKPSTASSVRSTSAAVL